MLIDDLRARLLDGLAIPAHPLALDAQRRFDTRHQAALTRYYLAAGAGGLAVGVHTTQFAIRDPAIGLLEPVLTLAADVVREGAPSEPIMVAGICGGTRQVLAEAALAARLGYHAGLVSLAALRSQSHAELLAHCRAVADVIPVFGFYLQPAVGGRPLDYRFWRDFLEIEHVLAIKVAPFNRYQSVDVMRALAESGRERQVALYTGNDDNIVVDLTADQCLPGAGGPVSIRFSGGLLGQWAVWTRRAVELLDAVKAQRRAADPQCPRILARAASLTDANAALFDVQNGFAGCIAGLHEILRRQGLLQGRWCLDPSEDLSSGQLQEIERVCRSYPEWTDDEFVAAHLDQWLA